MKHTMYMLFAAALAAAACDRPASRDADSPAASAPPVAAQVQTPATAASPATTPPPAPTAPPTPAPSAPTPDCASVSRHIHDVLQAQGSERTRSLLTPLAEMIASCEGHTNDAELMRCFAGATDPGGFDACNRGPFEREIDATPVRKFSASEDNSTVRPQVLTQDGDYLAYDDQCGMLYKEAAPAGAIFIVCAGKVRIGPLVNIDEIDRVTHELSADERHRHEIVMSMIASLPSGDFRTPVHVYYPNGAYKGLEYR